jgi:hypothetical protein
MEEKKTVEVTIDWLEGLLEAAKKAKKELEQKYESKNIPFYGDVFSFIGYARSAKYLIPRKEGSNLKTA